MVVSDDLAEALVGEAFEERETIGEAGEPSYVPAAFSYCLYTGLFVMHS